MSASAFPKTGRPAINILVGVGMLTLINAACAKFLGKPLLYCWIAESELGAELYCLWRLGLLFVMPLGVVAVLRGNREGFGLLFSAALYGGLPSFVSTLFNLAPGCGAQP
jgi:hypothetical protein